MTYHVNDSTLCTLVNSEYYHEKNTKILFCTVLQYTVYTFSVVQYSILITSIQYYNTLAMYSTWVYR